MTGETILLVDDEESCRSWMRDILVQVGYLVLEAEDYRSAVAAFDRGREATTLLVTDVSLPGPNGCELFKKLSDQKPGLRVLFVSGHVGAEVCRIYGVEMTDLYFLRKPFGPAELLERVSSVMRSSGPFPACTAKA